VAVRLYMDVQVPQAITDQLRRKSVDVLTAIEDDGATLPDEQLLERSTELGRVLFTQDIRFRVLAEKWQRDGRTFHGLLFGHQLGATLGRYVADLELIAAATDANEWINTVLYLPL